MSQTPSARRREGRHSFFPAGNLNDFNPYLREPLKWNWKSNAKDWNDGWYEAKAAHVSEEDSRQDRRRAAHKSLINLSNEERLEVFGEYCGHCGSVDPECKCWNDE